MAEEEEEEEEEEQPLIQPVRNQLSSGSGNMMDEDNAAVSLVGHRPARTKQFVAGLSATMGALSMGVVLGFSSPAGTMLTSPNNTLANSSIHLTTNQNTWFSSSMNLGALVGGPVAGVLINLIGRKGTMLASAVPFVGAWMLIAFGQNFGMLMVGRVMTGLCAGITSLVVPTYIGEFASPDVRGMLGSGFQLMVTIGVLYAYGVGATNLPWIVFVFICAQPVVIYFIMMLFTKESPMYLLSKGKEEEAAKALQYFRGESYNIQLEMDTMRDSLQKSRGKKTTLSDFRKPHIYKPMLISLCLMFFQQFSGVNAILFNLNAVFQASGSTLPNDVCSILVGLVQVAATFMATVLVDKYGRKILLIVSSATMALSLVALGEYFYLLQPSWLPLLSLIVFIAAFSIGYGPIPWLMMGELFSPDVKGVAAGCATMFNWSMSFVVTSIFVSLQAALHIYGTYWMFCVICIVSLIFCCTIVPETKGKTLDEITALFGGLPPPNTRSSSTGNNSSDC